MKNYGGTIPAIRDYYKKGIRPGIEVASGILQNLWLPDAALKIIHVAGTNGKGSVAEYLTQILIAAGKKVGTFVSPAVYDYCEQFKIDGVPMKEDKLEGYLKDAFSAARDFDATGFEIETAGALYAFRREGCEYAVIECGMGGVNDATNAILKKEIAIITSIGLEHTKFLGKTLTEIAAAKAGIIKNCPAIISDFQPQEVKDYFKDKSVKFADGVEILETRADGVSFNYRGKRFETSMPTSFQAYNAATAIEAARTLKISETAIYTGVKAAKLAGRLDIFSRDNAVYVLDGAHNPASFAPLAELLKTQFTGKKITAVYGCLADKDSDGALSALEGLIDEVIAVKPVSPRAQSEEKIIAACKRHFEAVKRAESVCAALDSAKSEVVVVCGSFTLLEDALKWIERK